MMDLNSTASTALIGRDQVQNPRASSYVLNGKIMLCSVIILFVVVFIIVCFHSYTGWLRHRHRYRHRRAPRLFFLSTGANTINTAPRQAHQALDLSVLKRIPAFVYSPNIDDPKELLDCAVCLSEFEDSENGRVLPKCGHAFHVDCIDMWFQSHSNCPLCRTPVQLDTLVYPLVELEEVVSVIEPAERDLGVVHQMGSSSSSSSSSSLPPFESASVEIPRARGNFRSLDDMGLTLINERSGFKSPGNRVLTLKRIWSI